MIRNFFKRFKLKFCCYSKCSVNEDDKKNIENDSNYEDEYDDRYNERYIINKIKFTTDV